MELQEQTSDELPLETVGSRLRRAREKGGLTIEDVAAQTKIAERHLVAIEGDRLSELASRTYAVGFSRAFARAVGLEEKSIAEAVRRQLAAEEDTQPHPQTQSFEPGDPARVPPARLALVAILGAVGVLVLVFFFWRSFMSPQGDLPDLIQPEKPVPTASASLAPAATGPAVDPGGPVIFTAMAPRVWVKFYDANGKQLFQKEMGEGESYTVPAEAEGPLLWTARPDALAITVGGKEIPMLGDRPVTIKDVPVTPSALLSRPVSGAATPGASAPDRR